MTLTHSERVVPHCEVLGVDFFAGTFGQAAEITIERALSGEGGFATLTSVHGLTLAQSDRAVRSALDESWMNFPDGVPITWVQHRSGAPGAERVCGIDLMPLVFELGQEMGLRHYLLGSTDRVLGELQRQITGKWPRAVIGGACSPPFGPIGAHKRAGVLEAISKAAPHLVWVGLGAPKQDLWGQAYASDINPSLALGVGAAFDFVAQTKDRAPIWMRERGLEWFYRLSREPRRLLGRYAQSNTEFILRLGCDYARRTTHRRDDQAHFSQAQHRSADDRDRDEGADYEQ